MRIDASCKFTGTQATREFDIEQIIANFILQSSQNIHMCVHIIKGRKKRFPRHHKECQNVP